MCTSIITPLCIPIIRILNKTTQKYGIIKEIIIFVLLFKYNTIFFIFKIYFKIFIKISTFSFTVITLITEVAFNKKIFSSNKINSKGNNYSNNSNIIILNSSVFLKIIIFLL